MNYKRFAAAFAATLLMPAMNLFGVPDWLRLPIMIFAALLVLASFFGTTKWVVRKNLELRRKAKESE